MGVTDTKAITKHIDQQFKSIRKYYDQIYGEITLLEQKNTKKMYALVQKVIVDENQLNKIKNSLQKRQQSLQYLVRLHSYHSCKIDYCSNFQKYHFLLEYSDHTLYNEMALRLQNNNPFRLQELLNIFNSYIEILSYLKEKCQKYNNIVSNHMILYQTNTGGLKTIQQFMKCYEEQRFTYDNFYYSRKSHLQQYFVYHSPEVFTLYCNNQIFYAKTVSRNESSVIFMLGMNFLQCALLADLSGVYNFKEYKIRFDKLTIVINKLMEVYGQEITQIIGQMLNQNPIERPTIQQLKNYNKTHPKRRKITIPKHTKQYHVKNNNQQLNAP